MLPSDVQKALINQTASENYSSHLYLAMASWCEINGLPGSAKFFYKQSDEEKEHMMKLFKYVNETGSHAIVKAVKEPPSNFKSLDEVFETALAHEKGVTKSINALVRIAWKSEDFATFNFLQWYVAEQVEEESLFNSILDIVKLAGTDKRGIFLVDREVGKKAAAV